MRVHFWHISQSERESKVKENMYSKTHKKSRKDGDDNQV